MNKEMIFCDRHIGLSREDQIYVLKKLGFSSMDDFLEKIIPSDIRRQGKLNIPDALSESDALAELKILANSNQVVRSLIGQGYYQTLTPSVIQRNVIENPAWYTAYTPYQPEISQGRLEALFNFQTMVVELTGLAVANSSLLDEGTAGAEAMMLCERNHKTNSKRFYVSTNLFTQTRAVIETRAKPLGLKLIDFDPNEITEFKDAFGMVVQYTGADGSIVALKNLLEKAKSNGLLTCVASDLLSLTLLEAPGYLGADVCFGSTQRFGVPMGNGGPHAAFFAVTDTLKRSIPGRLVGQSVDSNGNSAYRLTLQTREQHIRREKATSNICTAQVLLANIAGFYACYHGPLGLKAIASRIHRLTGRFQASLKGAGIPVNSTFFDTLCIVVANADMTLKTALDYGINLFKASDTEVNISFDEASTDHELEILCKIFGVTDVSTATDGITFPYARKSDFMTQLAFNTYHSETEMMRFLRKLADRDLALDRAMIPLGSCTMKLNAASEMTPISWPEFAHIHPFAPVQQREGYDCLIKDLNAWLTEITDYAAISCQPNSGAQGEYAGLLAIQGFHHSNGDYDRTVCLVPSSAHGTNPASAQMAGLDIIVIACDENGNIDHADLDSKITQFGQSISCLMITYPSTHGVFETAIKEVCEKIHAVGGQIFLDGANLNAQLGLTSPGVIGSDVSHLNLHKTFCIPHGGGGPGVGPIGVAEHLVPYMPGHPALPNTTNGPVSAAPFGSAMILPISWMYIRMMGPDGLVAATVNAILSANYIAHRLQDHFPVLYKGVSGFVAHECILDTRPAKDAAGVTVDDIAKRLIDYGFHAPTMSWPVAGTLMIEPTESESLRELDRFCEAMIEISREIKCIESGAVAVENSVLRHSPYTVEMLTQDNWTHSFSRSDAAFPIKSLKTDRYWPPVGRVDNVYGDRHLVCSCAPLDAYTDKSLEVA